MTNYELAEAWQGVDTILRGLHWWFVILDLLGNPLADVGRVGWEGEHLRVEFCSLSVISRTRRGGCLPCLMGSGEGPGLGVRTGFGSQRLPPTTL